LHCPAAALPVQLFFGPALEAFLLFLLHDQLLDFPSNQRNSIYSGNQRISGRGEITQPGSVLVLPSGGCQP
jgi:hypothetical protein